MQHLPQISDAEWQVMKAIWAEAPCTANQVVEYCPKYGLAVQNN